MASSAASPVERAMIVGLAFGSRRRDAVESSLEELAGLAVTAGATVVHRSIQARRTLDPAFFLGRGKADILARACAEAEVQLVIFDDELSPEQLRNLEGRLGRRVIDRTDLILDIFASRARTREGRLQVELAQLRYLLPRLTGLGTTLSRLGVGIGTRGPGETKLESARRRIRFRISRLTRELEAVRQRRSRSRDRRHKGLVPTVALVGYTNAGKTSLFNLLTGSQAVASTALFATLDPLVRPVRLPDRRTVLVSDTVGFIDRLPHTLVAAFRATLEELAGADLFCTWSTRATRTGSGGWMQSSACSKTTRSVRPSCRGCWCSTSVTGSMRSIHSGWRGAIRQRCSSRRARAPVETR